MRCIKYFLAVFWAIFCLAGGALAQLWTPEHGSIAVDVSAQWTYTTLQVSEGDTVTFLAKGTYSPKNEGFNSWRDWFGPMGSPNGEYGSSNPLPDAPAGCLIGSIGSSTPFFIGKFQSVVAEMDGILRLRVNDNSPSDNRGTLMVFLWYQAENIVSGIPESPSKQAGMGQNYPNPFNPETTIRFNVPHDANIRLEVHDLAGKRVRELLNERMAGGDYSVAWDGRKGTGQQAASGTYLFTLWIDGQVTDTRKSVMLK